MRPSPCTPTERTSASSTTGHCQMSRSSPAAVSSERAIASAARRTSSRSAVTAPTMRIARPGPGNGCRQTIASGRPSCDADPTHLVLEQRPQRLDEGERQVVRQPADVVVGLDRRRAGAAAGLHHVGVERALHEEVAPVGRGQRPRRPLERPDELPPDDLPLLLRIGDAGQRGEERPAGVDHVQPHPGRGDEVLLHLLRLAGPQQPVVDEHAGELVADGPLHQRRGDRRVDPAGQPADHPLAADLARGPPRPARRRCSPPSTVDGSRPPVEEALEDPLPVGGVQHLGVELHAEQRRGDVLERRDRAVRCRRRDGEPGRRRGTASPCDIQTARGRTAASSAAGADGATAAYAPNSDRPVRSTCPPSACAIAWKP